MHLWPDSSLFWTQVDKVAHTVAAYQPEYLTSKFGQARGAAVDLVNETVGQLKGKGVFGLAQEVADNLNKKLHDVGPMVSAKTEEILDFAEKSVEKVVNYPPGEQLSTWLCTLYWGLRSSFRIGTKITESCQQFLCGTAKMFAFSC